MVYGLEIFLRWVAGLGFTFLIGWLWLVPLFIRKLREYHLQKLQNLSSEEKEVLERVYKISPTEALERARDYASLNQPLAVPGKLSRFIEQLFFLIVVAFNVQGAAIAMIGWATVRLYTGWNFPGEQRVGDPVFRLFALSALYNTIVSLFFTMVGGLICRGKIWWWP